MQCGILWTLQYIPTGLRVTNNFKSVRELGLTASCTALNYCENWIREKTGNELFNKFNFCREIAFFAFGCYDRIVNDPSKLGFNNGWQDTYIYRQPCA